MFSTETCGNIIQVAMATSWFGKLGQLLWLLEISSAPPYEPPVLDMACKLRGPYLERRMAIEMKGTAHALLVGAYFRVSCFRVSVAEEFRLRKRWPIVSATKACTKAVALFESNISLEL